MKREGQQRLTVIPLTWREACVYVAKFHRHHKPPRGQKFAIGVIDESGELRGVATCGRSVARALDDRFTLEVNRTCTDGFSNANSALYGACARIAAAMGYQYIHTDIEEGEGGASLRAAGWKQGERRRPRKNWANSSIKLHSLRDTSVREGVARERWSKVLV